MLKKTVGLFALAVSLSAIGAPQTPRHSKMLFVKQTIFSDGITCTSASVSLPQTISNKDIAARTDYFRQDIAAQPIKTGAPCPKNGVFTTAEFPPVGLVNYQDLKLKLEQIYATEMQIKADDEAAAAEAGEYNYICYIRPDLCAPPTSAKQRANQVYAGNPSYALAIMIRNNTTDYATLTDEATKIATNYHMSTSAQAQTFKQSIRDYIKSRGIMNAYVDIETEVMVEGQLKRAAATMVIDKNDTASTRGQFTGTVMANPPSASPASTTSYKNTIDIQYTVKSQYPDFYNLNVPQLSDRATYFGRLNWTVPVALDPIMPTSTVDTGGAYDSPFPGRGADPTTDSPSIHNTNPTEEQKGAICALQGGDGCVMASETILSLMRKNNAGKGTFTYYGRWELKSRFNGAGEPLFMPPDAVANETRHVLEYDVCQNVRFFNEVNVQYTVQRYVWQYDLVYDPIMEFSFRLSEGFPRLDREVVAPNPTVYSSMSTPFTFPRDINTNDYIERMWMYDSAIIDPVKWTLSTTKDDIVASRPFTPPGEEQVPSWQPAMASYAPVQITKSNDLPSSVPDPTVRQYHFNCAAINEDQLNALIAQQGYGNGRIVPNSINYAPGNNDGDACTVSYSVYQSYSPPQYEPCSPVAPETTCTGNGPEKFQVVPYNAAFTNNACTESCNIGGALKTCARPRPRN